MNQDNKNAMIGMVLILLILLGWNMWTAPTAADIEKKRVQDSTATAQRFNDSLQRVAAIPQLPPAVQDSFKKVQTVQQLGGFGALATGTEQASVLENADVKITFTNKGGRIQSVLLKKYKRILENEKREDVVTPLYLLEDTKNKAA